MQTLELPLVGFLYPLPSTLVPHLNSLQTYHKKKIQSVATFNWLRPLHASHTSLLLRNDEDVAENVEQFEIE